MDEGHVETDKLLSEMERRVTQEYAQAAREMQIKLDEYLKAFERKDAEKLKLVSEGLMSQAEYQQWRVGQIMIGQRWTEMRDTLAADLHNTNMIARSVVTGYMPDVYALNHNYGTFEVEKGSLVDTSYTLYDRQTAERLMREGDVLKTEISKSTEAKLQEEFRRTGKDLHWQEGQIQSVTFQAIVQGESIPNMSKRIARTMGEVNRASTVRYARTATTAAENAGRVDSYIRAESMGIKMSQMWLATHDGRTRHSHRMMDGEVREVGEEFSNGCEYPGDPNGPDEEIWNCRCSLRAIVDGLTPMARQYRSDAALGGMTYEEWKEGKQAQGEAQAYDMQDVIDNAIEKPLREWRDSFDWDKWYDLSVEERSALYEYTGDAFEDINNFLRGGDYEELNCEPDYVSELIDDCTSALDKFSIKEDVQLFRGWGEFSRVAQQLGVSVGELKDSVDDLSLLGVRFTEDGFCSTAASSSYAWDKQVMLKIFAPKGTNGLYVDPISANEGEKEVLLQRGTTFEIVGIHKHNDWGNGNFTFDVAIVEQNPTPI